MSQWKRGYDAYWSGLKNAMLTPAVMKQAGQAMGAKMVELNRARLSELRNIDGSEMDPLTPGYKKRKLRRRGTLGVRDTKLTGALQRAITYRVGTVSQRGGEVSIPVSLDIVNKSKLGQLKGLSTGRLGKKGKAKPIDVIGLYAAGTAQGKAQRKAVITVGAEAMKIAIGKGKLLDV